MHTYIYTHTVKVSKPDVHDESFSIDLFAVAIVSPTPVISIGDISLENSRSDILLEIRFTCSPEGLGAAF